MKIIIQSKPPKDMRYDTLGDWYYEDSAEVALDEGPVLYIDVATTRDVLGSMAPPDAFTEQEMFLIALHELVEAKLCEQRGIEQDRVDEFDERFAQVGAEGEPGDHRDAPYRVEHRFAMIVEHLMAHELGMTGYGRVE